MHKRKKSHYEAALRIVRYVKNAPAQGLFFPSHNQLESSVFCDDNWGSDFLTKKSITGYCVKLGESMISWKVKEQSTVSRSSAKIEYRSMGIAVAETIWICGLIGELSLIQKQPKKLCCDIRVA